MEQFLFFFLIFLLWLHVINFPLAFMKFTKPWKCILHGAPYSVMQMRKNVLGLPDREIEIRDDKLKSS